MADRPAPLNVYAGDGTWVENRPSKWQQIRNILSPYVTEPVNAMQRLWNDPAVVYGFQPTEQTVADSLMLSGLVSGGSAFAPKPRNAMTMGIRAYHGSPHSFDKFSTSKIGTGEGAQAYGPGLYFAEREGIARSYRDALKPGKGMGPEDTAARVLDMHNGDREAAITALRETIDRANANNAPYEEVQRLMQAKNILNVQPERATGTMYEVDIAADPKEFIDWDAPLADQPELNEKLRSIGWGSKSASATGRDRIIRMEDELGRAKTRELLASAGIPGIKYYDASSRGISATTQAQIDYLKQQLAINEQSTAKAKQNRYTPRDYLKQLENERSDLAKQIEKLSKETEATRNYVVFDDKLINIVRKYGIAGASAMLGYNLLENVSEAQAEELRRIERTEKKK